MYAYCFGSWHRTASDCTSESLLITWGRTPAFDPIQTWGCHPINNTDSPIAVTITIDCEP